MTEPAKKDEAKKDEGVLSKVIGALGKVLAFGGGIIIILYIIGAFFSILPGPLQMIAIGAEVSAPWFNRAITGILRLAGTVIVFGAFAYLGKLLVDKMTEK
jgi:hypothetical protein